LLISIHPSLAGRRKAYPPLRNEGIIQLNEEACALRMGAQLRTFSAKFREPLKVKFAELPLHALG
jgi:hypothetical protein